MIKVHVRLVQALRTTYLTELEDPGCMKLENDSSIVEMLDTPNKLPSGRLQDRMDLLRNYEVTYKAFTQMNTRRPEGAVKTEDVAGKVTYQFWSPSHIAQTIMKREQLIPKQFKRVPPITRMERAATLSTACQTAFFVQTFFFKADCFMEPKPATCKPGAGWYAQFLPTWATFAAAIWGLMFSIPAPFFCLRCFTKTPVMQKMTPAEKKIKIHSWRFWQGVGWIFVFCLQGFECYWLCIFANEYSWEVFGKWFNAAWQSLLHRFFSAPVLRGTVMALFLFVSTCTGCCDEFLVLFQHILPVEPIKEPSRELQADLGNSDVSGQLDAGQEGQGGGGLADTDHDGGDAGDMDFGGD